MKNAKLGLSILIPVLLAGCSHKQQLAPGENDLGGGVTETVNGDEVKKAFDLNGDGKPDAYEVYKKYKDEKGKEATRLVRKEFDLNGDGKIDFWRWYDDKEQLEKEANDLDFNGSVDTVTYYEKGEKTKEERDFDAQNQPHTWI